MTTRKAAASLLYSTGPSINWAQAMRSFIEQYVGLSLTCVSLLGLVRQQRTPYAV